jgi:hypothetical protein
MRWLGLRRSRAALWQVVDSMHLVGLLRSPQGGRAHGPQRPHMDAPGIPRATGHRCALPTLALPTATWHTHANRTRTRTTAHAHRLERWQRESVELQPLPERR